MYVDVSNKMSTRNKDGVTLRKNLLSYSRDKNKAYDYYLSIYTGSTVTFCDKKIQYIINNIVYTVDKSIIN